MFVNVAPAFFVTKLLGLRNQESGELYNLPLTVSAIGLGLVSFILVFGVINLSNLPSNTFSIDALTDMVNQDPGILSTSEFAQEEFGTSANSAEMSQAMFNLDAALSRQIAAKEPDFIVWPENEFADADDPQFIDQLKRFINHFELVFLFSCVTPMEIIDSLMLFCVLYRHNGQLDVLTFNQQAALLSSS